MTGMRSDREVVRSYGRSFDDLVEQTADAMTALGHPSRHALPTWEPADGSHLRSLLVNLAMYCEKMEADLRGGSGLAANRPSDPAAFLPVYASARRLIILFRTAEDAGVFTGRVAAELFGDVDNVEEFLRRLDEPAAIVEAVRSLVDSSLNFLDLLPTAIQDGVHELDRLLRR
jgi:hypothetical protein